jgi:hypothetical protein
LIASHVARDFFLRIKLGSEEGMQRCTPIVQAGDDARTLINFLEEEGYIKAQAWGSDYAKKYRRSKVSRA